MYIIISAPSGCGKTTIVNQLIKNDLKLKTVISTTSRSKRPEEKDGVHYHFISQEQFLLYIKENRFLEYTKSYNNYYGITFDEIRKHANNQNDVILTIDYIGLQNIKQVITNNIHSIFIIPPHIEELQKRLISRNQDNSQSISIRIAEAKKEISYAKYYDFVVINDILEEAISKICNIIYTLRQKQPNSLI